MTINLNYWKTRVVRYPLLAVTGGIAIVATGLSFDLNKSEWAYWVQAIGSIGAILGAVGVANFQTSRAERQRSSERHEESRRSIELLKHTITRAGVIFSDMESSLAKSDWSQVEGVATELPNLTHIIDRVLTPLPTEYFDIAMGVLANVSAVRMTSIAATSLRSADNIRRLKLMLQLTVQAINAHRKSFEELEAKR